MSLIRFRRSDGGEFSLARECGQFLEGSYLEELCTTGAEVPRWAWLGTLAHAPFEKLVEIGAHSVALEGRPELLPWSRALAFLASELIGRASRSNHSVSELQSSVVIPLELEMEQELGGCAFGPSELTRRVLAAFEQHSPFDY